VRYLPAAISTTKQSKPLQMLSVSPRYDHDKNRSQKPIKQ